VWSRRAWRNSSIRNVRRLPSPAFIMPTKPKADTPFYVSILGGYSVVRLSYVLLSRQVCLEIS
jgi:hypothetical protein